MRVKLPWNKKNHYIFGSYRRIYLFTSLMIKRTKIKYEKENYRLTRIHTSHRSFLTKLLTLTLTLTFVLFVLFNYYLFWKLKTLIEKAKIKPNNTVIPT